MNTSQWVDLCKWIVMALGAMGSFWVIDVGRLRLEEFKAKADNKRALLEAYLKATETVQPDVWTRKLHVLEGLSDDQPIREWAEKQLTYIQRFAARDALYREALNTASQLVYRGTLKDPKREAARQRFEQLYWADLVFIGESKSVEGAMVNFRDALELAEASPGIAANWGALDGRLLALSKVLKNEIGDLESDKAKEKR